ncbi:MAG: TonB-dependent receptor [Mangrovibacterium sp.]
MKKVTVREVLSRIEDQSEFHFMYSGKIIDINRLVSINVRDAKIDEVLKSLFAGTDVNYTIKDRLIVLTVPEGGSAVQQQTLKVSGRVTDSSGAALPGVTIVIKGTTIGTITDADGKYNLSNVQSNAILVFSFVGMKTQEVPVTGKTAINVALEEETVGLEEVVAVGYGSQKRVNLTGSIASVTSEKLTVAPVASTTNTLAGRLPGLISKQESGVPGGDASSLSIRGFGAPLVIVDGVESSFNNIDANEIETVSVLKDAAAAIYGARAGDGVILVTTKRGTTDKPTINLRSSITFQGATNMPKMASSGQMAELWRETQLNSDVASPRFTEEQVEKFYAGTDPDYPNTDWWSIVGRDWSPQSQHNLSIQGGSDKIKYYGFLGYLDQQSMFKKNSGEYQRYNLRSNIDAKILDNLSLQLDLSSIVENRDFPQRADEKDNSVWSEYWNTEPFWSPTLPDPDKIPYGGAGAAIGYHYMTNSKLSGYRKTNSQNLKGTLSLKYDFKYVKGLSAKAFVNYNQDYTFLKRFSWLSDSWSYNYSNNTYTQQTTSTQPELLHTDTKSRIMTGQFSLHFDRKIADNHEISAMALYELIDYNSDWINAKRIGYKTTSIDYLFAGGLTNQVADGSASESGRRSLIGRVNYAYQSKYLLEGTLRIDESSRFDKEHRRGYFPSVSVGWRLSEENFIKNNIPFMDNLKLRLSYSETGKDEVANFAYLAGYQHGDTYLIGSATSKGLVSKGMENPLLTWEEMTIYNAGLDFSLFNRNLYGEFDVFYRDRDGIPEQRDVSIPDTFGATLPVENLNSINTRGFELTLGTEGRLNDLIWDVSANLSWSRSKWGFYDEPVYDDPDQERQEKRTGQWFDRSFGYISDGVFTSQDEIDALDFVYDTNNKNTKLKPGDIRYKEYVKDGLLDWRDKVEIGKGTTPHWMCGVNLNLNYKNFDLSALFQGAFGFYNQIKLRWGNNFSELMYNERWTPDNNRKDVLIERLGGAPTNGLYSDFYYKKADYIRLKTFSLGYNLPSSILGKLNVKNVRVYGAATNLFTISGLMKYSLDPEAPNGYGGLYYPQMRTITFGLNLTL